MKYSKSVKDAMKQLDIKKLRPKQGQAISSILNGRDTMVIAPTSFGKSILYLIPAIIQSDKLTIVVEPLLALMHDQVKYLRKHQIAAAYLDHMQTEKEQFEEIEKHLKEISERFEDELQYQLDSLAVLEMQEKNEEYLKEAEKMPLILEVFPEMILRKKVETYGKQNDRKAACKAIDELADTYGDPDAVFAKMLLSLADGDYISAGTIANFIMEQEQKKANLRFYLTMYMQIFILYMGFDRKPDEKVKSLMEEYARMCLDWFENAGFDTANLKAEIKRVL